jgi:hypothetical protein
MRFDIRAEDSVGALIGLIEAPSFFEAAQRAAGKYFKKPLAIRETGRAGGAGIYSARSSVDDPPVSATRFHVSETKFTFQAETPGMYVISAVEIHVCKGCGVRWLPVVGGPAVCPQCGAEAPLEKRR